MAEEKVAQRVAVAVGTGPDIGGACAIAVGRDGTHVVCLDRDKSAAAAAADAVVEAGGTASYAVVDVTDRASVRDAFARIGAEHGHIDVLVNVVGGSAWSLLEGTSDEEWDHVFDLNLRQQWIVAQEALKLMTGDAGAIVMIASMSGMMGSPRHGAYGAAKAGVINLAQTLAVENAGRGQCCRARIDRNRGQGGRRLPGREDPAGTTRSAAGHRQRGGLPGLGRCRLHHRPGARRRRRCWNQALAHRPLI